MNNFCYLGERYHCESVSLEKLAKEAGTPLYVYSRLAIERRCVDFIRAFESYPTLICYAVKANSNLSIIREITRQGLGADLVSLGELERAITAGVNPKKIVFSGVGKTFEEICKGLAVGILFFNVESFFEVDMISQAAKELKVKASISLRINPNIDAKTNAKISTGLYSTKFGLPESDVPALLQRIAGDPNLELVGLACHIGSQITDLEPLELAAHRMADLALNLKIQGFNLDYLDLGGGLGIRYNTENPPSLQDYAKSLIGATRKTGLNLVIEPGRSLIGSTGVLLTKVIGVKSSPDRHFIILDAGMNDLIRPTLYEAYHEIIPVVENEISESTTAKVRCDFVGPVCETGDYLAKDRLFTLPKAGDLLAVQTCGAYGSSMSSQYNSRPRPAEILISGSDWFLIRPRESLSTLWESELKALDKTYP